MIYFTAGILGLLTSCAPAPETNDSLKLLPPREQLIRLSVDLRGIHPTEEELIAIESAPNLYEDYVDRYLEDPRYLERMRQIYNQRYLTRTGNTYGQMAQGYSNVQVASAIGDEPLQLLTHIIENDLPYSDIVTADYTMANPVLAQVWDLDTEAADNGWTLAHYTDGRPHAGILSMNGLWQRYPSMGGNANRHRANALSKVLLCDDYLSRPVVISRAAVDQLTIDPENAIAENPSCQSCHSSLDPLASHFYGFFPIEEEDDTTVYKPENEEGWRMYTDKESAYFGIPTANLVELGDAIAQDPRFVDCAVRTAWEGLTQRDYTDADWSEFQRHREAFEASELSIRHLTRSIVMSDEYRVKNVEDDELSERMSGVKVVNPYQLSNIIEDITGYTWTLNGVNILTNQGLGVPVLLGGLDGDNVSKRNYNPSVGLAFVQERLAQAAGWHVAQHDLSPDREGDAILLHYVTYTDTPDSNPEAFKAQIEFLYLRATGKPLDKDGTEAQDLMELWDQLHSIKASPTLAWSGLVSAVLRDPSIIVY